MSKTIIDKLNQLGACSDACDWLEKSNFKTSQAAWDGCERGDWMLWLLGKLSGKPESAKRKQLVRATCGCARLALKYVKDGEHRPRICIEATEAWADGKSTIEQVKEARSAADVAAYAAADVAAYASASAAAAAADAAASRNKMRKDCADVVRKLFPKPPKL